MTGEANAGLHRLMVRYIDGDERAFAELHRRLEPRLRALLHRFVREPAAVDDVIQVVWLKAHLARARFVVLRADPDAAVASWYLAIARNAALDQIRGRARTPVAAGDSVENWAAPEEDVEALALQQEHDRELVDTVHAALAELPPRQREVVELHKLKELSMADIAARLRVREGALRVRAHRAYRALAALLGRGG